MSRLAAIRARFAWVGRLWRADPLEGGGRWRLATLAFGGLGPAVCFLGADRFLDPWPGGPVFHLLVLWSGIQVALLLAWLLAGRGSRARAAFLAGALWAGVLGSLAASAVCTPPGVVFFFGGLYDLSPGAVGLSLLALLPPLCLGAWFANALLASLFTWRQRSGRVLLPALAGLAASLALALPPVVGLERARQRTEAAVLALDAEQAAGPIARMRPFAWACDWSELVRAWGRETRWGEEPETPRSRRIRDAYRILAGESVEEADVFD